MSVPYKRTDPGKLAREREAIRKSQERMNKPPEPNILQRIDTALKNKIASNRRKAALKYDIGGPFGSPPLRSGAEVIGQKKRRSIPA